MTAYREDDWPSCRCRKCGRRRAMTFTIFMLRELGPYLAVYFVAITVISWLQGDFR